MPILFDLSRLPLELLPTLLASIDRRQDLVNLCLTSKDLNEVATVKLYRWIRMFGRDLAQVPALFEHLSTSPRHCRLIRKFEIRVFPLSNKVSERAEMDEKAVRVLQQCVNLQHLIWTRKGALTARVLEAITQLPQLSAFELNASSGHYWSTESLIDLPKLRSLSIVLPDRSVASVLGRVLACQAQTSTEPGGNDLEELTILCRESPVVSDSVLEECIASLAHCPLTSLALVGCSRLGAGNTLLDLLKSLPNLTNLALEATAITPSFFTLAAPSLIHLQSLKLTHPGSRHPSSIQFFPALSTLVQQMKSLRNFTLYHSGGTTSNGIPDWLKLDRAFVDALVESVGSTTLRKFECSSGIEMSMETLGALTAGAPHLVDLVVNLGLELDLDPLGEALSRLNHLTTLHILSSRDDINLDDVLHLAVRSSRTLHQIGVRNRVWMVQRTPLTPESFEGPPEEAGEELPVRTTLKAWTSPVWPEALLVIRT